LIRGDAGWLLKNFLLSSKESTATANAIDHGANKEDKQNDVTVTACEATTPATKQTTKRERGARKRAAPVALLSEETTDQPSCSLPYKSMRFLFS
jgi:hypothetical protein